MTKFLNEFELLGHNFITYRLDVRNGKYHLVYDSTVYNSDFVCKNCGIFVDKDYSGNRGGGYFHSDITRKKLILTCEESIIKNLLE